MNSIYLYVLSALLLCLLASLGAQHNTLEFEEISRFAYTSHDGGGARKPVVNYPYVYLPDTYGIQACLWDSTANTFERVCNLGFEGRSMDIVGWNNCLFVCVSHSSWTQVTPEMAALHKIDVSNPTQPQMTGSLTAGESDTSYGNLRIVNDVLMAYRIQNGYMNALVLIDPETLDVLHEYPDYYRYSILDGGYLITRAMHAEAFNIFTVDAATGLTHVTDIQLPYEVNSFPAFVNLGGDSVVTQFCHIMDIWDCSDITDWQLLSTIDDGSSHPAVNVGRYLIFDDYSEGYRFFVYDVLNPAQPVLVNEQLYPEEPGMFFGMYSHLFACGSYVFQQGSAAGFNNYVVLADGQIEYGASCYEYNAIWASGRKYGNHLLLPVTFDGLICFDVSDPANPVEDFRLFDNATLSIRINGSLLYAFIYPDHQNGNPLEQIYDITDLQNPQLLFSQEPTYGSSVFFNPDEANTFYKMNFDEMSFEKYLAQNGVAECVWNWPTGSVLVEPVFSDGHVYCAQDYITGRRDLHVFEGFAEDEPALLHVLDDYIPELGRLKRAGDYVFTYDFSSAEYAKFLRDGVEFTVDNGLRGFGWGDFVGVGHDMSANFYDVSQSPSGFLEPDTVLPQHCPIEYIERDDEYMYVFTNSNIAIYSYTVVGTDETEGILPAGGLSVYPNPFNPRTTVAFTLPAASEVELVVYNIRGRRVATLVDEYLQAGEHAITWTAAGCASGVYFTRLEAAGETHTRKMLLLK
ncbi:MAG: T9SS type A sorting domain-containing protein [Candidatus Cloacimonetes bacterium]|nr:T9SS type A sorting domain-containing protein [Candidatus Cloacimonadota bacterium]